MKAARVIIPELREASIRGTSAKKVAQRLVPLGPGWPLRGLRDDSVKQERAAKDSGGRRRALVRYETVR
jgi:hypothetical protein